MDKREWREVDSFSRSAGWRIAVWTLGVIVFSGVIGVGVWGFKVSTSETKGAGDQTRMINDAQNRTNAQEWFHSQYAAIEAADAKLDGLKQALDASVGKDSEETWRASYVGAQNRCLDMVKTYNAETQKVTRGKWLDPQLPFIIDETNTKTDCKETVS